MGLERRDVIRILIYDVMPSLSEDVRRFVQNNFNRVVDWIMSVGTLETQMGTVGAKDYFLGIAVYPNAPKSLQEKYKGEKSQIKAFVSEFLYPAFKQSSELPPPTEKEAVIRFQKLYQSSIGAEEYARRLTQVAKRTSITQSFIENLPEPISFYNLEKISPEVEKVLQKPLQEEKKSSVLDFIFNPLGTSWSVIKEGLKGAFWGILIFAIGILILYTGIKGGI